METKDHLSLARALAAELQLTRRRRIAFVLGNLTPDLNPLSYLSPSCQSKLNGHSYEHRREAIEKSFARSFAKNGCRSCFDWYRAGKAAHYLADSFTRPHNERFSFGYWEHVAYEHQLHQVFHGLIEKVSSQWQTQQVSSVDGQWYRRHHERYIKESEGCLDDCAYILQAASAFCAKLTESK